ncbi:MAG: hypothetical protein ACI97A_002544 [Planctomycetota bacterium]|jgi:hypothetical protein
MQTSINTVELGARTTAIRSEMAPLRTSTPNVSSLESEFSAGESALLRLFSRVEEMRVQMEVLKEEVRLLKEERELLVFSRDVHDASKSAFRFLPDGRELELDGESYLAHTLVQIDQNLLVLARTKRAGRTGQLLLVRRGRLARSESLGPLEERILALLVARRDSGTPSGLNARELEHMLEKESNVLPLLPNAPVDSSIRSSVCRLRNKLARLAGPRGQILTSECGYRLRGRPETTVQ